MRKILIALEPIGNTEAIYVDGKMIACEETVYAADIVDAAGGVPVTLDHRTVELGSNEFPEDEADLVFED